MELVELIILIAIAITFSNIFSRIMPVIPSFLIQIFLGILLGLTSYGRSITFEPEIFLVMIIAPLLFREGEQTDIPSILKNFGTILALAFGGVILTLVAVGGTLYVLMPTIPLAACFAFGAALGPTDAVAVGSISRRLKIPERATRILEGEGLLNDASGVTAFQFAVVALTTGSFSLANASVSLIVASLGGVAAGMLIVWLKRKVTSLIERASAQDVTAYMLIELLLPFAAYLLAESLHVSGIIAAVVAGVMQARGYHRVTLFEAELANVSETTWSTIVFTLNGLVFLFLGIEIAQVFSPVWESSLYSNWHMLGVILAISGMLFLIRFVFLEVFYGVKDGLKKLKEQQHEILLLTFGGVKGTVSLATIFILPMSIATMPFKERSVLLFLTAGVIMTTLVVAMVVLPILADGEAEQPVDRKEIEILAEVIENLQFDLLNADLSEKEKIAIQAVIENYNSRIWDLHTHSRTESEQQEIQEIQALILSIERDGLDDSYRKQRISNNAYRFYSHYLANFQNSIGSQILSFLGFWLLVVKRIIRVIVHPKLFFQRRQQDARQLATADINGIHDVFKRNTEVINQSLDNLRDVYDSEILDTFLRQRNEMMAGLDRSSFIQKMLIQQDPAFTKEMLRGYYLERKIIDEYEVAESITTFSANDYRQRVNLLESYAMSQIGETPSLDYVIRARKAKRFK